MSLEEKMWTQRQNIEGRFREETQREENHQQVKERPGTGPSLTELRGKEFWGYLVPRFVVSRTEEKITFCCSSHYVILYYSSPGKLIGKIDAEAETATLWPHDAKNCLTGKDPEGLKAGQGEDRG